MADEDPKHTARLRALPCAIHVDAHPHGFWCEGPVAVHHATHKRAFGQRAHDHDAMPLCAKHHTEFHLGLGYFVDWSREKRRAWQDKMVEIYRPKNDPEVF